MFDLLELRKLIGGISASGFSKTVDIPQRTLEDSHRKLHTSIRSLETAAHNLGLSLIDTLTLSYVESDEPLWLFGAIWGRFTDRWGSVEDIIPNIEDMLVYQEHHINPVQSAVRKVSSTAIETVKEILPGTVIVGLEENESDKMVYIKTEHPGRVADLIRRRINLQGQINLRNIWYAARKRDIEYERYLMNAFQVDHSFGFLTNRATGYVSTYTTIPMSICSLMCKSVKYQSCNVLLDEKDPIPTRDYCTLADIIVCVMCNLCEHPMGVDRYQIWIRTIGVAHDNTRHTVSWSIVMRPSIVEIVSRFPGCIAVFQRSDDPTERVVNMFATTEDMMAYKEEDVNETYQLMVYWYRADDLDYIFTEHKEVIGNVT